ncbi:hypothetical protein GCM10028798_03230 [Humibacter antri]
MEDWALIRRLAAEGVPKARIAERLGVSRTTVLKAVRSESPPRYERVATESSFVAFESRVRVLLAETPDTPATVLAERVGWSGSITWFRENVKRLRPQFRPIDPADRLTWDPGDAAQCDLWFPPKKIPLEDGTSKLLPVLVITAAHSRFMVARMIPTRTMEDLLLASWELIQQLGRVPRRLIWDNEAGIGRGHRPAQGVAAFMGTLATKLVLLPPRDPESKGVVERRKGWFETSFMPRRSFLSPEDFTLQFGDWLDRANRRVVRTTGAAPIERVEADRAAMLPFAADPAALGLAQQHPAGPGLLRPPRHERLLRRPRCHWTDGRRQRRPGTGESPRRRADRRRPRPGLGARDNGHRSCPRGDRGSVA